MTSNGSPPTVADDVPIKVSKWYLLTQVLEAKTTSAGGIALPASVIEAQQHLTVVAKVVGIGPLANKAKTRTGLNYEDDQTNPVLGDYVIAGRYVGMDVKTLDGRKFKFLNDYEVLGITTTPQEFVAYV